VETISYSTKIFIILKMDKITSEIVNQIDEVILEINTRINTPRGEGRDGWNAYISSVTALHTKISALFHRFAPKDSPYNQNSHIYLENFQRRIIQGVGLDDTLSQLRGILESLKEAYIHGYFRTVDALITGNIFSDFLDMAEYFLSQGDQYKHPAAFLIGGVLEEHLRKLAIKNEIQTMKDNGQFRHIEDINIDLRKKDVYSENERKSITAWLGLRNDVDHAHWEKYSQEKVEVMLKDVRRIINQYPA
jgi:hypothetical protein